MHFLAQHAVAQQRPPVFGREDEVDQDFCQGLRHGVRMRQSPI